MKRLGHLLEQVAEPDNLRLAFWKASRGRRAQPDVRHFAENLDRNLTQIRHDLLAGTMAVGSYHYFTVRDPKERLVCAASFPERVLHHALMNLCEPVFERAATFDSYACRKGKGREAALVRACRYATNHAWFLKLDIRKFFDSVDQRVVLDQLSHHFKDQRLLDLFRRILATYSTTPGAAKDHPVGADVRRLKSRSEFGPPNAQHGMQNQRLLSSSPTPLSLLGRGLPIGNLTSQHLANDYLAPLDRFVKETLACAAYVRYMDDFVLWSNDRAFLRRAWVQIESFLESHLKLRLKPTPQLNRTSRGMDFLGCRLVPGQMRLSRRSKQRFTRKLLRYEEKWLAGEWSETDLQRHAEPLLAFVRGADSEAFRRAVLRRSRVAATGLEPRHTGGQLEQRRQQLHVGQPQQQQPVEPQQQQRVPRGPRPSSPLRLVGCAAEPDAILPAVNVGGNARSSAAKAPRPPGVSSAVENSGRTSESPVRGGMFIELACGELSSPVGAASSLSHVAPTANVIPAGLAGRTNALSFGRSLTQLAALFPWQRGQPGTRRKDADAERSFQHRQIRVTGDDGPRARRQACLDHDVILGVPADLFGQRPRLDPLPSPLHQSKPRLHIGRKPVCRLDLVQRPFVFLVNCRRHHQRDDVLQPGVDTSVAFLAPEDARRKHPGVNDDWVHWARTSRSARSTMRRISFSEWLPAGGWASKAATSAFVSAFTGRINSPPSPRSNTFNGPPCSRPTRRHHSNGNTVCRLRVKVIVVVFMGNILLHQRLRASPFLRFLPSPDAAPIPKRAPLCSHFQPRQPLTEVQ